jgi:hypothetical protein
MMPTNTFALMRISPISAGKLFGITMFCLCLLMAPFTLTAGIVLLVTRHTTAPESGSMGGIAMIALSIVVPFVYGIVGFFQGFIAAWIYNLVASKAGGLELQVERLS